MFGRQRWSGQHCVQSCFMKGTEKPREWMLQRQKRTCTEPAQYHRLEQRDNEGFPCRYRSLVTGQCHKRNSYIPEKFISRTFRNDHGSWPRCYSLVWPGCLSFILDWLLSWWQNRNRRNSNQMEAMSPLRHVLGQGEGQSQEKQMADMSSKSNVHFQPVRVRVWLWPWDLRSLASAKTTRDKHWPCG